MRNSPPGDERTKPVDDILEREQAAPPYRARRPRWWFAPGRAPESAPAAGTLLGRWRGRAGNAFALVVHSLSGRLLLLTLLYVLISEVLILVPSLGRYHRSLLEGRIESSEIAILPFTEVGENQLSEALRKQLLARANASAVMLKRSDQRELFLRDQMPSRIDVTIDLRNQDLFEEMFEALDCMAVGGARTLRVIAPTHIAGAESIDAIIGEASIRGALMDYADRLVLLGFVISLATALLVFASLYLVFVRPMGRLTRAMVRFQENPDDAGSILSPSGRKDEIGLAEHGLADMQRTIFASLQQRARLAALGSAVAKIQHDLRNMLSTAQLASDRLSSIEDPVVQKLAPRLVSSLGHAVALATNTLRYGRADEQPPKKRKVNVLALIQEVREAALASSERDITFDADIEPTLEAYADPEQLYRILLNLIRNAVEAVSSSAAPRIMVFARPVRAELLIDVADNGAGIAETVREKLFQPFSASSRPGGTGLGLAIARELARAHGGSVTLVSSGNTGTVFRIAIPEKEI